MAIPPEKKKKIDSLLQRAKEAQAGTDPMLEETETIQKETSQLDATSDYLLDDQKKKEAQARRLKKAF